MNHSLKAPSLKLKLCLCLALFLTGCVNVQKQAEISPSEISPALNTSAITTTAPQAPNVPSVSSIIATVQAPSVKAKVEEVSEPPADIWVRIRQGFAMPDLESDLVKDREDWYAARPDYMVRMTERSRKYLFHIVEEL